MSVNFCQGCHIVVHDSYNAEVVGYGRWGDVDSGPRLVHNCLGHGAIWATDERMELFLNLQVLKCQLRLHTTIMKEHAITMVQCPRYTYKGEENMVLISL